MDTIKKITNYFNPIIKKYQWHIILATSLWIAGNVSIHSILPLFYRKIIDEGTQQFAQNNFQVEPLMTILIIIAGISIFSFLVRRGSDYLNSYLLNDLMSDIHNQTFNSVAQQSYHFFSNQFTGTLVSKAGIMARNFRDTYLALSFGFLPLFINLTITIVILLNEDWRIAIMFIGVTVVFVILSAVLNKQQVIHQKERAQSESLRVGIMSDIFSNIINTKIFATLQKEIKTYGDSVSALGNLRGVAWRYADNTRVIKNVLIIIFQISTLGLAIVLFIQQKISLGTLILIQTYMVYISDEVWALDKMLNSFSESLSESSDAIDVLTAPITMKDPNIPETCAMHAGKVNFDNINFTYPEGDHVFENFSLHIPAGQSVGIVGKSGSGKTTITKLLLRFYDVDGGSIKIDDQDIRDVRQDDLRNAIAYIPQESILFHRSIKENIGYSKAGATDEEIIQAAKFAHADEFIASFEHGYETKVGERGVKLSGGQRQRVSIARAMLKHDAPILIMDEATSSLDTLSEQYIQESFEKLMKNRTTIVIAHRLSTIQKMDRIIVLDRGAVVEDGTHQDLLAQGGYYAELWGSQMDGFIE